MEVIYYTEYSDRTVLIPLRYVYPECSDLIKEESNLHQLLCMTKDTCPKNKSCPERLAKRIFFLFDKVVNKRVEAIVVYYKRQDNGKLGAVSFSRDMNTPYTINVVNPSALKKFTTEGTTYEWVPSDEYKMLGQELYNLRTK